MSAEGWLDLGSGWLFASIRDAVLVVDAQTGGIVLSNPAATDLFGHSADELRERSIELVVPDLRLMPQWETLLAGPAPADTILVFGEHRDGTEVSVELTLTRLESPTDGRLFLVAVMRDITERRLAEEERIGRIREHAAQQESAAAQLRLEVLADASRLLDASLDYEATLQEVARVAASTLADWCIVHLLEADGSIRWLAVAHGDPDKEAVARELHRRYPATLDRRQGVGRVLSTGETEVYARIPESQRMARARDPEHLRLLRALGSCSSMIVPLSTRGRMLGALSLISSRPDRHYDKNDVATAEELARRCAQAVDNARLHQEAQTALRAREQFVSIASHELRTPIARVKGYAEMLLAAHADGELDDELLVRSLRRIDTASERLAGLVRDLLDVSRMTSGGLPLRPSRVDLAELLRELVGRYQEQVAPEGHARLDIIGAPPTVPGDPERLEQVFQNLLDNAVKYSPEGADLRVRVQPKARGVLVEVQDRGMGLPSGAGERIFEAFGRGSNAEERQIQGMGLGLYICRNIVEQHRGRVWAKSEGEGCGTQVSVWLPQAGPKAADDPHPGEAEVAA